jgi:16S rRNA G966 N2-methylase RsmD
MGANETELFKTKVVKAKDGSGKLFEEIFEVNDGPVTCLGMEFENDDARRDYFTEKLREKLKDTEFRQIEGFPIGEDEAILTLSDPPYYTACPNPWIKDFVNEWEKQKPKKLINYKYQREPFAADIREGKQDPVCMAHTYHTKVPYRAIARYIMNYTNPGDIILDCFAGTGMTGVAAQVCSSPPADLKESIDNYWDETGRDKPQWGNRNTILIDLSPFATFLERNFNSTLSPENFKSTAENIISETEKQLNWMYQTNHPISKEVGVFEYGIWSDVVFCECGKEVTLWEPNLSGEQKTFSTKMTCPNCGMEVTKKGALRAKNNYWDDQLNTTIEQNRQNLVLIQARFGNKLIPKNPNHSDLELISKVNNIELDSFFPTFPMMFNSGRWGDMFRAGIHYGVTNVHHFWTKRNLITLSNLFKTAQNSQYPHEMTFLMTSFAVKTGSRMHNVGFKNGRINLAGQTYNTLQFPSVSAERNLFTLARGKLKDIINVFEIKKQPNTTISSTQSGTSIKELPNDSVDYVFIDPPFGDNIIYSELSFLYESWLKVFTKQDYEAIISGKQKKGITEYKYLMTSAFKELFRVLKPGRWITIAFHNSKNAVWNALQESIGIAGFVIADVRILDKGQGTYKQMTTTGAVKQDLILSAYRPNGGLEERFELESGGEDGVWDFIRTHLKHLPVFISKGFHQTEVISERQNYLLFDRMVAFHVQRGVTVPVSASEFYLGLDQRFAFRDGMYFLPDQVDLYDKKRMTVKEVLQLQLFVTDESSAIQWLKQQLIRKPQSFQSIHPLFMKETAGWSKTEVALELSTLLEQNFLCYEGQGPVPEQIHAYLSSNWKNLRNLPKSDSSLKNKAKSRWYVPDPNKAGDLEKLREKSLFKEFEQYKISNKKLKIFRLEAMRAGFKKAWQEKEYHLIIQVAEKMPNKILEEDQKLLMWYDQALTRSQE